jgi:hypothetical protein
VALDARAATRASAQLADHDAHGAHLGAGMCLAPRTANKSGGSMNRQLTGALLATGTSLTVWASATPAAAAVSGIESFHGVIVKGRTGAVITSLVVAKGVFHGVGQIVETSPLPGDPDNVNRDDLVFATGSMHIVSTILAAPFSLNPHSCLLSGTVQQTGKIVGGTGQFAAATGSYTARVKAQVLLARNPDGSCSFQQEARHEVDQIAVSGTLSF